MTTPGIRQLLATLALGVVLVPVAFAEPPADKGKGAGKAQVDTRDHARHESQDTDKGKDKGKGAADDGNRGQVVSECNHRANEKSLKGKDRQEYLEWCTEHGDRDRYDDRRYDQARSCYRNADDKGLSGDFRRTYIQECVRRQERNR